MAGAVSPVNKTITYGTVTGIPGESSKCWITSNLGANHQAAAVDDDTWNDAWASDLKLHGAGYLMYFNGDLYYRGVHGPMQM